MGRQSQQHFVHSSSDISRYIIDIYRSSRSLTISDFRHRCFDVLQQIVPFEFADWTTGICAHETAGHFTRPFDDCIESGARHETVRCPECSSEAAPRKLKFHQHFWKRGPKVEADTSATSPVCDGESASRHTLTTKGLFGPAGLFIYIRIHRSGDSLAFSCQDQIAKRQLISHIVDAYDNNLHFALRQT